MKYPYLGYGLGLRSDYFQQILSEKPAIDWFEIISENFMLEGGRPLYYLDKIRQDYPMAMHGVSLSVGSSEPLNQDYLKQLKVLVDRVEPAWVSDHLCWTGLGGTNLHDLLPLPYTEEAIDVVVENVKKVQDFLGRRILLENVSSYITYKASVMTEWEFINAIVERADCLLLLDINNIYVSAFNHRFDPKTYLEAMLVERVQQFHLAGHLHLGTHIIDTHDHPVIPEVWDLYALAVKRFGAVSTMIERDAEMPPWETLMAELQQAKSLAEPLLREKEAV